MRLKLRFGLFFGVLTLLFLPAHAQHRKSKIPIKVVGYYSLQSALTDSSLSQVPFNQLTHINLWFLNPDSLGHFTQDFSSLKPFIDAAHAKKVNVLASIGGGSPHPYYHNILQDDKRALFIQDLMAVVLQYNLDGIDVDLEGGDLDSNYENFVTDLAIALRAQNKMITAAVAVYYKDALSDKALAQFDFVSVMSYDRTGPWKPENPGPHATYANAVEDFEYFAVQRALPKEKLVLGVPFYGYGFGPTLSSPATSMDYNQIVTQFPGAEHADEWKTPEGQTLYYNGVHTIKQKTALAMDKASGVMIWQIKGDAPGNYSLLHAIHEVIQSKNKRYKKR